jgi:3-hydroxyisobutyrate dehydrogenase
MMQNPAELPAAGREQGMKIGIAGTGRMGTAICERLMAEGFELVVWNRTKDKTKPLVAAGAGEAATPAELVAHVDTIITILTNADSIDAVYRGPEGLLSGDVTGKLFVEMSTVRPVTEETLGAEIRAKGGAMVDAPVGGTTGPAKEGKLIGVVGGDEKDVARARLILEKLCRRLEHVGPLGAGASFKLAINLPLVVYWQALGEALSLCTHHGVDPSRIAELIADTSAGPNLMKVRGWAVAAALKGETVPATFDIDSMRKDMRTMLEEAEARGVELPLVAKSLACYDECAEAGLGAHDPAAETAYWVSRGAAVKA